MDLIGIYQIKLILKKLIGKNIPNIFIFFNKYFNLAITRFIVCGLCVSDF